MGFTDYVTTLYQILSPAPAPARKPDLPVQYQIVSAVCATQGRIDLGNIIGKCATAEERETALETVDILVKEQALRQVSGTLYERLPIQNRFKLHAQVSDTRMMRKLQQA